MFTPVKLEDSTTFVFLVFFPLVVFLYGFIAHGILGTRTGPFDLTEDLALSCHPTQDEDTPLPGVNHDPPNDTR